MKKFIILPVVKNSQMTAAEMVYEAWDRAKSLQMIIQFELDVIRLTYRIYPDMKEKEVSRIAERAQDLEDEYKDLML